MVNETKSIKKQKISLLLIPVFLLAAMIGCSSEEQIKPSITMTHGVFTFEMPEGFKEDTKARKDHRLYYISDEFGEASKVIYDDESEIGSLKEVNVDVILEETNNWLREDYLTNSKAEIVSHSLEETEDAVIFKYTISYNLYSAIVTHHHIYYEKDGVIEHLEYTCVEEEGYDASFQAYYDRVSIS